METPLSEWLLHFIKVRQLTRDLGQRTFSRKARLSPSSSDPLSSSALTVVRSHAYPQMAWPLTCRSDNRTADHVRRGEATARGY